MREKEIKLRIFPENKENLIKIDIFKMKIQINRAGHAHKVETIEKIVIGKEESLRVSYRPIISWCGYIFFPFRNFYEESCDFKDWQKNEWVTIFACEEIITPIKWYCDKILKLKCEETVQEY